MQGIELAQQRWALLHNFDIDVETWEQLFASHQCGDILQAIRQTRRTRATEPAKVFLSLCYWLSRVETERAEQHEAKFPVWPPSDVQQN